MGKIDDGEQVHANLGLRRERGSRGGSMKVLNFFSLCRQLNTSALAPSGMSNEFPRNVHRGRQLCRLLGRQASLSSVMEVLCVCIGKNCALDYTVDSTSGSLIYPTYHPEFECRRRCASNIRLPESTQCSSTPSGCQTNFHATCTRGRQRGRPLGRQAPSRLQ